ncbi:hypothetical protein [Moritella sp.]|uniref:hypothetical protein n=1 Tax=Moritella sp. TaxID=78556 RepID=UPI001D1C73BE|nr:hypothetical protein [Moritella sp.]MCJ8349287.1 hypothetical protein [Moritella sp.]NQZ39574.1 hypothetical protein [Moritella sp.]
MTRFMNDGVFNGVLAGENAVVLVWDNTAHVLATDDSQMEINFTVSRLSSTGNDPDVNMKVMSRSQIQTSTSIKFL